MGFLVVTCIGRVSSFLGIIHLSIAMIIMGGFTWVCAVYSYLEAEVFFTDTKAFWLNVYALIEGAIAILLVVDFFIRKKNYTLLLYLITVALAGIALAYNIFKISIFNNKLKDYNVKHKLIQFMFFIRIGVEFFLQMCVSYVCYCYKKSL